MSKTINVGLSAEVLEPQRRRCWLKEAKAAIVAKTYVPGVLVSVVIWRSGIAPSQMPPSASSPKAAHLTPRVFRRLRIAR